MSTVNCLNHLLQSRAGAPRSLTRSQQRRLKCAQQEVTLKDQPGNLFVVSHLGEERLLHSSLTCQGGFSWSPEHVFGIPRALLAALLCLSLSHGAKPAAAGALSPFLTFLCKALAIFLLLECRQVQISAFRVG